MRIPSEYRRAVALVKREATPKTLVIVLAVVLGILVVAIFLHLLFKSITGRGKAPTSKGRPGWNAQVWREQSTRGQYSSQLQGDELSTTASRPRTRELEQEMESGNNRNSATEGVNRNTSVRSIMTLPAYSPAVRENERILAREGERGGIDTVIEFPESHDEEEARREEEMESLYQIRLARRAEQTEREERRVMRRDARQRGDFETLSILRRRAEQAAQESVSATLIAEHQTADRSRRVSSVQYADLGVARHDGTRIRASTESERPLLDSATSIEGTSIRTLGTHQRGRSASSVLSISTNGSDDFSQRRASGASANDFEVVALNNPHSRSPSLSHNLVQGSDMGDQPIPHIDPPTYDDLGLGDAPPYESPIQTRANTFNENTGTTPQLPTIQRLPSIHITSAPSPIDPHPPIELPANQPVHAKDGEASSRS